MANHHHPTDVSIEDLSFLRFDLVRDFTEDDGEIDVTEQGILLQFDVAVNRLRRTRNIQRATELAMKQEGRITDYTRRQFEEAGLMVAELEPNDAA